ncbi:MAG: stage II sporulation protein P [Butyricicoccus sp.]|nr:stage II sporulation protein P [Butyricicoccus sp.]
MKKGIVSMLLVGAALRLAMLAGAGEAVSEWAREISSDGSLITATLSLELGSKPEEARGVEQLENEVLTAAGDARAESAGESRELVSTMQVKVTPTPTRPEEAGPEPEPEAEPEILTTTISAGVSVSNDTSFDIDLEALAAEGLGMRLERDAPQVLIVHTHSSEAYAQDPFNRYEESDAGRTEDTNYNVVRVGDELAEKLEEFGVNVIHDREIYDYPSYTGSYTRSGEAVERYLADYPSVAIVIDLHRDALGSGDVVYKTQAEVKGRSSAQVMMLIGTGENGLHHPYWQENLKLALYMQNAMDDKYPTLARPIALKKERYNQHLTTGSMILEVGSSGNTLDEALLAIDLFADSVGPALAELIED